MARKFKTVDYEAALELTITIGACLPPHHLARFVVETVSQLDLYAFKSAYTGRGSKPYHPAMLLGLLFYRPNSLLISLTTISLEVPTIVFTSPSCL